MKGNLSWMDLEMTGLYPARDVILEIATIVTDKDLNVIAQGPVIAIHQEEEAFEAMDDWNTHTHNASGLIQRCRESAYDHESAEKETLEFLREYLLSEEAPLCGNSIHQDRRFLRKYMPDLDAFHSYRIVDVTSIREMVDRWYPDVPQFEKNGDHKALDDILDSIGELAHYREHAFK